MPPYIRSAQYKAFTGSSSKFANEMGVGLVYRFTANRDCWVKVTVTGGAAAADTADNHLVIAGQEVFISSEGSGNGFVHIISDGVSGDATLSLIEGL